MIWESWPWKQELQRLSRTIEAEAARVLDVDNVDERSEFELEHAIFYAAFVVRKLIENRKVTDKVAGHSIEVKAFRSRRPKAGNLNFALSTSCDLDKEYDLERSYPLHMAPSDLAGEIIHSHKLMWDISNDWRVIGIYLCSYRQAEDRLICLPLELLCSILSRVTDDEVTHVQLEHITKPSPRGDVECAVTKQVVK